MPRGTTKVSAYNPTVDGIAVELTSKEVNIGYVRIQAAISCVGELHEAWERQLGAAAPGSIYSPQFTAAEGSKGLNAEGSTRDGPLVALE